ncbi:uncharacterized protein F4812DRAFT_468978 [Daldinia caldariorum]|uniref:uncharacterized protein n=1 Tax=Daldinia caldariorum TaxID=326644 RepID=UPI0020072247|nr:uncharacterized protein F4812DRAFT_468978 [Daldinia caldariorum]KAI1470354.1 hypothetical protein F4812DRAFT_468978 [Daldinia caldariorum]
MEYDPGIYEPGPYEPGTLQMDEWPTIPSSMDPILSSSTGYQPPNSTTEATELREHTRSPSTDENPPSEPDEIPGLDINTIGAMSTSPVRANVKRRRSVVSAPGDILARQSSRRDRETVLSNEDDPYRLSSEKASGAAHERVQIHRQASNTNPRCKKRAASHPQDTGSRKRQRVDGGDTVPANTRVKRDRSAQKSQGVTLPELPLLEQDECIESGGEVAYERKGIFRLKKDKERNAFRFPKPLSQPEPVWRAGDGFSEDEAKPSFLLFMTGISKQKRIEAGPGLGKLQLETETASRDNGGESKIGCTNARNLMLAQSGTRILSGTSKDVWPTKENFAEKLGPRHQRSITSEGQEVIIPSTILEPSAPKHPYKDMSSHKSLPVRKRKNSDFENFGRHLKESSNLQFSDSIGHQGSKMQYTNQPKPADGGCEQEEECEGDLDDVIAPSTCFENEIDEDHEALGTSYEDTLGAARSRESSARDSAIFVTEDTENELSET